ncbi:MAG: LLM class F420-dependent oxidoreductase [Dehalococcoidia bacterium]|tara:strand:- start:1153 stop:2025 length:873 start_codon:yes stop_codon:yes gene_type:complete
MRIGAVFPQTEAGTDIGAITDYIQNVESLGFDHILAFDHVLGANASSRPGWSGAYQHTDSFYEPITFYSYVAAITSRLELATGVIILPQRQTALFAKQTATLDLISGGRLRLGIGTGWNQVEYEALGENFHNRGKRSEEQINLLRKLWSEELITFEGKFHTVTDAGLNPLPPGRSIPIWFGGMADPVLERVAKIGDGWLPLGSPNEKRKNTFDKLKKYLEQNSRSVSDIGIEAMVSLKNSNSDTDIKKDLSSWAEMGTTHISINTMNCGLKFPGEHITAISNFMKIAKES